ADSQLRVTNLSGESSVAPALQLPVPSAAIEIGRASCREREFSRQMTTSTKSIDIMGLQAAYANLHTDQERDYFMQRYHDVISYLDRKSGSAGMPRPISYAVFCLKKKKKTLN